MQIKVEIAANIVREYRAEHPGDAGAEAADAMVNAFVEFFVQCEAEDFDINAFTDACKVSK